MKVRDCCAGCNLDCDFRDVFNSAHDACFILLVAPKGRSLAEVLCADFAYYYVLALLEGLDVVLPNREDELQY